MIKPAIVSSMLLLASSAAFAADASLDSTAALARARELRPFVSSGTPGPLWNAFDDAMRAAMGDSLKFAGVMASIHGQTGTIAEVLAESVSRQGNSWVYHARCRFEKVPIPLALTIALEPDGRVSGLLVQEDKQAFASTKLDYITQTILELPFHGEWFVYWGGRTINDNYHAVSKSQRFANDLFIMKEGASHAGNGSNLADYYCYGAEVLAPAAGSIVWSCDSLPDQVPGQMDPKNPVGNGVVIDHGNGEFSVLAHMQPKSLQAKTGDKVKTNDVLGLCGNSGNTSEPHVHYHLQDGPDMKTAEGLPAPFANIIVNGKPLAKAELLKGQTVSRGK